MKKILIIGASSGIGKSLALLYAREGHRVAVSGRRVGLLREIQDQYPERVITAWQDIRRPDSRDIMSGLVESLGGLDLLIVSAGIGFINKNLQWDLERQILETNVRGFTDAVGFGYDYFSKQKHGHLAGIGSIAGIRGIDLCPAYSASKAYMTNYLEALRRKSKKEGANITVTTIVAGFVDTAMAQGVGLFWVAKPEKAARQIALAMEKKRKIVYVTRRWRLIAWLLRMVPAAIYEKI
jgi:short-subunit dehydrogenase